MVKMLVITSFNDCYKMNVLLNNSITARQTQTVFQMSKTFIKRMALLKSATQ